MSGELRARLQGARLYLLSRPTEEARLNGALRGGVDLLQLVPPKGASDEEILSVARRFKAIAAAHGVPLLLNTRSDLVEACGADGVHLNADDGAVAEARKLFGPEPLIGLWTSTEEQIEAASRLDVDYISVGPVNATPTLAGLPATGADLAAYAAGRSAVPVFAIGGIDATTVPPLRAAGVSRVAVLRLIADATDPESAAAELKAALG